MACRRDSIVLDALFRAFKTFVSLILFFQTCFFIGPHVDMPLSFQTHASGGPQLVPYAEL